MSGISLNHARGRSNNRNETRTTIHYLPIATSLIQDYPTFTQLKHFLFVKVHVNQIGRQILCMNDTIIHEYFAML